MEELILKYFNDYESEVNLAIGIIGILLAFVFYLRARNIKRINYLIGGFVIYLNDLNILEKLKMTYDNQIVKQLSSSVMYFWNSGDVTIDKTDIPLLSPLLIGIKDPNSKIVSIELERISDNSNNFKLIQKGLNKFELDFDYIDKDEGCTIKILHSGYSKDIFLEGKLKGVLISKQEYTTNQFAGEMLFSVVLFSLVGLIYAFLNNSYYIGLLFLLVIIIVLIIFKMFNTRFIPLKLNLSTE